MAIVNPVQAPRTNDQTEVDRFYRTLALRLSYQTYAGDPTGAAVPRWVGDRCLDTTNSAWYTATGTTAADWV